MNSNNPHSTPSTPAHDETTVSERIQEEIMIQRLVLSNLHTQRNSLSFAFRLPTEILETIFIDCARDCHREDHGLPTQAPPSWVNVSYVCRHWRNVALNCPTLWTYFFMTSPRWTEELLARSRQATLKLHLKLDCQDKTLRRQWFSNFLEQLMDHVERIQELRLQLPSMCDDFELDSMVSENSSCARRLKNLSLGGHPPEPTSLLFDVPAFRTLELSYCSLPWHSLKLSGLTTLSLRCVPARFQQSTAELLVTLSYMQDLAHLYLEDAIPSAAGFLSSSAFDNFQKIGLPHLSRILIVAPLSAVVALLSCINIPLKTVVRLECHYELGSSLDDYAPLSSLLPQRFGIFSPTIRSLRIESAEFGRAILAFSASERDCNSSTYIPLLDWGCNIPLLIVIHFGPSIARSDGDHIIGDICRAIPLTNVQSVHVLQPPLSLAFWKHALGHLQDLRYLKLSVGVIPDLTCIFSILSLDPHDRAENEGGYTDRGPGRVLFAPALEGLELHRILFLIPPTDSDVQHLYHGLWTTTRGRLTMTRHASTKYGPLAEFDMVWRWEAGHSRGVESAASSS